MGLRRCGDLGRTPLVVEPSVEPMKEFTEQLHVIRQMTLDHDSQFGK
jgi:hypothetical protein